MFNYMLILLGCWSIDYGWLCFIRQADLMALRSCSTLGLFLILLAFARILTKGSIK